MNFFKKASKLYNFSIITLLFIPQMAFAEFWAAQPIVVHEWGVQVIDWSQKKKLFPKFPKFIYTAQRPGKSLPQRKTKVKELPKDSGIREKPVLYFYPKGWDQKNIPIGVEVGFMFGEALAWWPQVDRWVGPDYLAPPASAEDKVKLLSSGKMIPTELEGAARFHDLFWYDLRLSRDLASGQKLLGSELPQDHWIKTARRPNSYYVSNGREVEKFLFYEGWTFINHPPHFNSRIKVLPPLPGEKTFRLLNHHVFPIHDVLVLFRDSKKGIFSVKYFSSLKPSQVKGLWKPYESVVMPRKKEPDPYLKIQDWKKLKPGLDETEFLKIAKAKLWQAMTANPPPVPGWYTGLRNPAHPQGQTKYHQLFPEEAQVVLDIWKDDFFKQEGLTIIYREDPEQLDMEMPLYIYTDMYHYIQLSRLGLVVHKNVSVSKDNL